MKRPDSTGTEIDNDKPALDAESFSSNRSATPIPHLAGEGGIAARWITPIYGQRTEKKQSSSGGKGGKGGGGGTTVYFGVVAGAICAGPLEYLGSILENGQILWQGELYRETSANPVVIDIPNRGTVTFYWGTESQPIDSTLASFGDHPAYRGLAYFVWNGSFGDKGETNAPNLKFYVRRKAQQGIITGQPAAFNGWFSANPAACAVEYLTDWNWGGLNSSQIVASSFQSVADELQGETDGDDIVTGCAPLITDSMSVADALAKLSLVAGITAVFDNTGKIVAKRWKKSAAATVTCTEFTFSDFTEPPSFETEDADSMPNTYVVEYRNSDVWHRGDGLEVNNPAFTNQPGAVRVQKKVDLRDLVHRESMGRRFGQDLVARTAIPELRIKAPIRREKAVNPDGSDIRPGNYFKAPITIDPQVGSIAVALFRCVERSFEAFGDVELVGERDVDAPIMPASVSSPEPGQDSLTQPPINLQRLVSLPPTGDATEICALVARPHDGAIDCAVSYSPSSSGDFQNIGRVNGFALPLRLNAAFSSASSTVRVQLLSDGANGEKYQRELHYLTSWTGGAVEGRDNQLLLILCKVSGGSLAAVPGSNRNFVEVLSVNGTASIIASGVYDIPVLRGRLGTSALDFSSGSFPAAFSAYEGWLIPRSLLSRLVHADFSVFATGHFRLAAESRVGIYDPAEAYQQRQALAAAGSLLGEFAIQSDGSTYFPTLSFSFPGSLIAGASSITTEPSPGVIRLRCAPPSGVTVSRFVWYRSASNSFASASAIGTSGDPLFDDISVTSGATYYYWVACLDVAGNASAVAGAASAVAVPDPVDGVPGAANYISNSDFLSNYSGWYATYHSTAATQTIGRADPASGFGLVGGGSVFSGITGIEAAGAVFDIDSSSIFPVRVGQRYQFSAYISPVRLASAKCMLAWYDSTGNYISEVSGSSIGSEYVGGSNLSDYGRSFGFATAPAGAAQAKFFIRAVCDGVQSNPVMFATRCFFGEATDTQNVPSPWTAKAEKGDDGDPGTDATSRRMIASAASIARSTAGVLTPASVTFSAQSQTGTAAPTTYAGRWIVAETTDGSAWTDVYTSSGDESTITRTPGGSAKAIRARLYLAGGTATKIDETTIPIVNDGQNGADGTGGMLGQVEGAGSVSSTTWALVSALSITVTLPAGARVITFTGAVVNSSGSTKNVAWGIGVNGAGNIVIDDDTTLASGAAQQTVLRKSVTLTAGVHTIAMYAYSFGSASTVVVSGLLTIE